MKNKDLDLKAMICFVVLMMGLSLFGVSLGMFQWIPGILLAIIIPGYAIRSFLIRDKISVDESLLLSLGLSLITDIFTGFLLNVTPWGLNSVSWTIGLGMVTLIASLIALMTRSQNLNKGTDFSITHRIKIRDVIFFGLAVIIAIGAFITTKTGADSLNQAQFTQLWMLPFMNNNQETVELGIQNNEMTTMDYILSIYIDNQIVYRWDTIQVKPGKLWAYTMKLPPQKKFGEIVQAVLSLKSKPDESYRWTKFTRKTLEK